MARCEDYPCCGHTPGDPCPDRDSKGRIVARCVECNKRLPSGARSSICMGCQHRMRGNDYEEFHDRYSDDY